MLAFARGILPVRHLMASQSPGNWIDSARKLPNGSVCQHNVVVTINHRNGIANPVNNRLQQVTALPVLLFGSFGLIAGFFEHLIGLLNGFRGLLE